jgi:hypothetical protein
MARSCTFYCRPSLLDPFIPRQEPWGGSGMPAGVQSRNPEIRRRHGENTYRVFCWILLYHNLTYTKQYYKEMILVGDCWGWSQSWKIHFIFWPTRSGIMNLGPSPGGRTFHCGTLRDGRGCRNWAIASVRVIFNNWEIRRPEKTWGKQRNIGIHLLSYRIFSNLIESDPNLFESNLIYFDLIQSNLI